MGRYGENLMKILGISPSAYDTYSQCEWLYFLQQVLYFDEMCPKPDAILGTIAHKVLEILSIASLRKHRKDSKIWDVNYLWTIVFNRYCKTDPESVSNIKPEKLEKVCLGIHNLLNDEYTPIRDNTLSAEAKFHIPLMSPEFRLPQEFLGNSYSEQDKYFSLRGRIDRIDRINDDTIEVIDYKSGQRTSFSSSTRHKKEASDLHEEIQPRMYHLAAKHLYPWAKNIIVTFIYLTDGGAVPTPFSDADINTTKDILLKRFRAIKANIDPQRNRSWKCSKICSFGKDGQCELSWIERCQLGLDFMMNKYSVLNVRKYRK